MKNLALTIGLMLALTACGSASAADQSSAAPSAKEALAFSAPTVSGASFEGRTLVGKDAVLWFWAPWCTKCRREAPDVAQAQADNPDVTFVGVAGLGEVKAMREFLHDYHVGGFEHLVDDDGSLWRRFGVVQQPAFAFIDDSGSVKVVRSDIGANGIAKGIAGLTGN